MRSTLLCELARVDWARGTAWMMGKRVSHGISAWRVHLIALAHDLAAPAPSAGAGAPPAGATGATAAPSLDGAPAAGGATAAPAAPPLEPFARELLARVLHESLLSIAAGYVPVAPSRAAAPQYAADLAAAVAAALQTA